VKLLADGKAPIARWDLKEAGGPSAHDIPGKRYEEQEAIAKRLAEIEG